MDYSSWRVDCIDVPRPMSAVLIAACVAEAVLYRDVGRGGKGMHPLVGRVSLSPRWSGSSLRFAQWRVSGLAMQAGRVPTSRRIEWTQFPGSHGALNLWFGAIDRIGQAAKEVPVRPSPEAPARRELFRRLANCIQSYGRCPRSYGRCPSAMPRTRGTASVWSTIPIGSANVGSANGPAAKQVGVPSTRSRWSQVLLNADGHPLYTPLATVPGFTGTTLTNWAKAAPAPNRPVGTEGWVCWIGVITAVCPPSALLVDWRQSREWRQSRGRLVFGWIHTIWCHQNTSSSGANSAFKFIPYGSHHRAACADHCGRHFHLDNAVSTRLLVVAVVIEPRPARGLRRTEAPCSSGFCVVVPKITLAD